MFSEVGSIPVTESVHPQVVLNLLPSAPGSLTGPIPSICAMASSMQYPQILETPWPSPLTRRFLCGNLPVSATGAPRIHLAFLQWSCPPLALLLYPRLQLGPQTSAKIFDPDVLKQCFEAALIPFMQLLLKLLYGPIVFLHLTHWSVPSPF